jgi:hypothetical protein
MSRGVDRRPVTNVPRLVVQHSPTGFEWGYGGSGPADLALNILECVLREMGYAGPQMKCYSGVCFKLAYALHQDFKWEVVARLDEGGGVVYYEDVVEWIRNKEDNVE